MTESSVSQSSKRFLVALSFPGEQRGLVATVAGLLSDQLGKQRVLYDKFHEAEFARPDLDIYLQKLYHDESELLVVFLCVDYERKDWPGLEWRAIRDLIKKKQGSSIMLVRLDDASVSGLFSIDGFVSAEGRTAQDIATLIIDRLGSVQAEPQPVDQSGKGSESESGAAWFSDISVRECAETVLNLAYYNPEVHLEGIALWWILAYDLWCRSPEGPFTNADILVSYLPNRATDKGGVELDEDLVLLALTESVRIGYLREIPARYSGVNYEITATGREYFARCLVKARKSTKPGLTESEPKRPGA